MRALCWLMLALPLAFGCGLADSNPATDESATKPTMSAAQLHEVCIELTKDWIHVESNQGIHLAGVSESNCVSFEPLDTKATRPYGFPQLSTGPPAPGQNADELLPRSTRQSTKYVSLVKVGDESFYALNLKVLSTHDGIQRELANHGGIRIVYGHYCASGDYFHTKQVLYKDGRKTCAVLGKAYLVRKRLEPLLYSDENGVITSQVGSIAVGERFGNATNFVQVDIVVNGEREISFTRADLEREGIAETFEGELYIKVARAYEKIPALAQRGSYAIVWRDHMHAGWGAEVFGKHSAELKKAVRKESLARFYPRDKMRYDFNEL